MPFGSQSWVERDAATDGFSRTHFEYLSAEDHSSDANMIEVVSQYATAKLAGPVRRHPGYGY